MRSIHTYFFSNKDLSRKHFFSRYNTALQGQNGEYAESHGYCRVPKAHFANKFYTRVLLEVNDYALFGLFSVSTSEIYIDKIETNVNFWTAEQTYFYYIVIRWAYDSQIEEQKQLKASRPTWDYVKVKLPLR